MSDDFLNIIFLLIQLAIPVSVVTFLLRSIINQKQLKQEIEKLNNKVDMLLDKNNN